MNLRLPFTRKKTHVGVSIEDQGIRYTEARNHSSGIQLLQTGIVQIDNGLIQSGKVINQEALELQLALAKKDLRLKGKKAVLAVPSTFVVIRKITLPKLSPKEIRPLLEIELETTVHLPFSRPYFDYYWLREIAPTKANHELAEFVEAEDGPKDEYLIIAAPGDVIDQYVKLLKLLDLAVVAVEIEPLALYRLLEASHDPLADNFMIVQLGLHSVNVSIFQKEIPEFLRNIPIDLTNYQISMSDKELKTEELYRQLDSSGMYESFVNDLIRELDRVINFYQFSMKNDGTRLEKIYITGDFPDMEKFLALLGSRLVNLEVNLLPIHHLTYTDERQEKLQAYTVAAGLSLRG